MAFSRIYAAALLAQVIATPLCAFLMSINPWIPVLLGLAISCLGLSLVVLVPETLPAWKRRSHLSKSAEDPTDDDVDPCPLSLSKRFKSAMQDLSSAIHLVRGNLNLGLILFSFLVANLGSQMTSIFLQYSSIKLHWTIAKVRNTERRKRKTLPYYHYPQALINQSTNLITTSPIPRQHTSSHSTVQQA